MEAPLCPRCGADTFWFPGAGRLPYCSECGWNLDEVYRSHHKQDRLFRWLICSFAVLICVPAIVSNPRQGVLLLAGLFVLAAILFAGSSKTTLRLKATRQAVAQKPGSDLSSTAAMEMPPRVAYVPVFYDAQNPENCAPACALNYDLLVPEGFARR
jgi:hypothetical protein